MDKKFLILSMFSVIIGLTSVSPVWAVCPVCTVAVGMGLGLSRYFGVDDLISGVWIGALTASSVLWFLNWLDKKQINFKFRKPIVSVSFYLIVAAPLYFTDIVGHPLNKFLGVDRLLFGIISGSLIFISGVFFNNFLKNRNNGKVYFYFQKVVIPVLFLVIISLIFYFINASLVIGE